MTLRQHVPGQGFIFLHVCIGGLHVRPLFGIVENIAEDLLLGRNKSTLYTWQFPSLAEYLTNTLPSPGDTHVTTEVMPLLKEDVLDDRIAYGLGNLSYFPWCVAR